MKEFKKFKEEMSLPEFDLPDDRGRPDDANWIAEHQARNLERALSPDVWARIAAAAEEDEAYP